MKRFGKAPPPPPPPMPTFPGASPSGSPAPPPPPPPPPADATPKFSNAAPPPPTLVMPSNKKEISAPAQFPTTPTLEPRDSTESSSGPGDSGQLHINVPSATDSTALPAAKPLKEKHGRLNRFFQSAKPGRILKGFRKGDTIPPNIDSSLESTPSPPVDPVEAAKAEEARIKADRHAAQMADYEERVKEWNQECKRKEVANEALGMKFDPDTEMRPKPKPPAPLLDVESDDGGEVAESIRSPLKPGLPHPKPQRATSFRPINTPVVAEGQSATEIAELFAAKAYGAPVHPAAAPGHVTSISSSAIFGTGPGPMLPPGAAPRGAVQPPPEPTPVTNSNLAPGYFPPAQNPAVFQSAPPPPAFAPNVQQPPAGYGMQQQQLQQPRGPPLVQSNTYIDPQLAERIRRGRELTKLGIQGEESGNMGHAKEAYMKALELLIPAIKMLDHGNDVSYSFRMSEKRKLNREAGLMLDRCEAIKKFLESEVAALNTRSLLESAPVPVLQPKKLSLLRQESMGRPDDYDNGDKDGGSGGVGLARKPVIKKREDSKQGANFNVPKPPPPPKSSLLDGFTSLTLSDPLVQQARPAMPAPLPGALSRDQLRGVDPGRTIKKNSSENRQQALSRPPDVPVLPSPPAFPATPPMGSATARAKCEVCKTSQAALVSKCDHSYCASCMNKAASFGLCLQGECRESGLTDNDFKHFIS